MLAGENLKLLVLGGQGVVFDAALERFFGVLARAHRVDPARLWLTWERHVRDEAWRGSVSDEGIWRQLVDRPVDAALAQSTLRSFYEPAPAVAKLRHWAGRLPVWLLSNHRSDWVLPVLDELGVTHLFDKILISDQTGRLKPEPEAFHQLLNLRNTAAQTLVVDDQLHNLCTAAALGFRTLQARPKNRWAEQIDDAVQEYGGDSGPRRITARPAQGGRAEGSV